MSSSSQPAIARINYLNAVAYVANVVVTYAVGAADSSHSNAAISAKYQTIVTPAGWAFAIWGVIFISQLIWAVAQLRPAFRASPLVIGGVGWYYLGVAAAQIAWTLLFSFELISLSLVAMLLVLFFLDMIVGSQCKFVKLGGAVTSQDYWILRFPFEIHAGWIIAASLVNINLVLVAWNASATVQFIAALLSLLVLLMADAYFLHLTHPVFVIPLVLAWASVRIMGCCVLTVIVLMSTMNSLFHHISYYISLFQIAIAQELKQPQETIANAFSEKQISIVRNGSIVAATLIMTSVIARFFMNHSRHDDSVEDVPAQPSDPLVYNSINEK